MKVLKTWKHNHLFTPTAAVMVVMVIAALWGFISISYADGSPTAPYTLDVGYLDFAFGSGVEPDHTASRPESKVWWNDGFWWASMWSESAGEYHIYRLNWGSQTWHDTGVAVDDRPESRADVYWDEAAQKLYIASHFKKDNPSQVNNPLNWARLYRYSYDDVLNTYTLDPGFYVNDINVDKTNTLVIDKDDNGRLWATYVSRPQGPIAEYQVYVNVSDDDGATWETQYSLYNAFPQALVSTDDYPSIVAFGGKIGLMWTNQIDGNLYYSEHALGTAHDSGWSTPVAVPIQGQIDDHLSLKADSAGRLFAAIKTTTIANGEPLIGMVTRSSSGQFAFHVYSAAEDNDTRPIIVVDEGNNQVYLFVTGKPGGSMICYKTAEITTPLSNMQFPTGDCGTQFIADLTYDRVDSSTSSKHVVNDTTGLLVLASDDHNGQVYVHNVIGDPPPVVTNRTPARDAVDVPLNSVVTAQFSKNMNIATVVNNSNFYVEDAIGPIAGTISYNGATRTATFTPNAPLVANTVYTATVTTGVQDDSGNPLYEAETWSFQTGITTQLPTVSFSAATYDVAEDAGTATITVTLSMISASDVTVTYATGTGTATANADYTPTGGPVTIPAGQTSATFTVTILDDALNEPSETVNLSLSNPQNATLGTPSEAVLTILDNDAPPTVAFSMAAYTVNEGAGSATITVVLSGPSGQTVAVDYATSDGTATAGDDYVAASGTLDFAVGETSKTFTVSINDDNVDEADETINLTLSNPDDATLGTPSTATLTIVDDDTPGPGEDDIIVYLPVFFSR